MRRVCILVPALAVIWAMTSSALAGIDVQVGDVVYEATWPLPNAMMPITNQTQNTIFNTFCVEAYTPFAVPNVHYTVTANDLTVSHTEQMAMTGQTAWLYTMYRTNPSVLNWGNTDDENNALQYAIWLSVGYQHAEVMGIEGGAYYSAWQTYHADWDSAFQSSGWGANNLGLVRIWHSVTPLPRKCRTVMGRTSWASYPLQARRSSVSWVWG